MDMSIHNSTPIMQLLPGLVNLGALGVDYKDSIQPLIMEVSWLTAGMERKSEVVLRVPIGELVQPLSMNEEDFVNEQGKHIVYITTRIISIICNTSGFINLKLN